MTEFNSIKETLYKIHKKKVSIKELNEIFIKRIKEFLPKTDISSINKLTKGQAITCLEGLKNENDEMAVTIGSCDAGVIFNYNKLFYFNIIIF